MTSIPPLRPTETGPADVEPAAVLHGSSPVRTAAAIAAAAAVFLAIVVLAGVGRLDADVPAFLADALGPEKAEAPMERTPATGVGVRINDRGYSVSHWGKSVSVASEDVGGAEWRRHVNGVTRETDFGAETILIGEAKTESFLTVAKRQGDKTWRWRLASRLSPRLDRHGAVTFLDPTSHRVTSIVLDPVRILDTDGKDVTPDGLRWGLEERSAGWMLTLKLDDSDLPLPYVIDPAVTHRTDATAATAGATSLDVNVPTGVQANDLLVAHIARVGNAAVNTPTGWTAAGGTNNGSFIRQATYYRVAGSSEPASYTWTWTGTQPAVGGMSAYYGVKASAPLDVVGAATTANNTTSVTAPALTTTANDALVLAFFSSNTNSTYSTAAGMSERYEIGTTGAVSAASDDMTQAAAGSTGAKTSTASTSGRVVGHQVAFNVDDVAPTGSLTDPGSPLAGTVSLAGSAADTDSAVASVLFQRSPADAGTWTNVGAADTTSPYAASFDTTAVADGLYDLRVVITDVAGNATNSTIIEDRRVDNTVPASTTTFPAASGTYNVAGWEAGCTTIGLCGTYSDGGSGVSQVQVSIRQGVGSYWNGSDFSSGTEVWNTANLSAGSWSYPLAAAGFPAAGPYTVRVRAIDGASNTESPSSRTFTIDPAAPQTTIDSSPSTPTGSTSADFSFSSSEGGSTFECRLDGGSWSACTSPQGYTSLTDGSHTFDVRATDAAGNTDGSPASFAWLVDTTAPSSTTTFPAASGEYNAAGWTAGCATAGLCGTYSDGSGSGVAQVQVSIRQGAGSYWDGSGFASGTEIWNAATLAAGNWSYGFDSADFPADGAYTVRVRATDAVANTETPSTRSFEYDDTDPAGSLTAPADGAAVRGASVIVSSDSADAGSGVASAELQRRPAGGGAWTAIATDTTAPYSADWDTTALADGDYDLRVVTTDQVGNTFTSPARTVTVDNTAPSSATLDLLPGAIRNGQELTGAGADATSGVESLTYLYCSGASCTPSTPIGSSTSGPDYSVTWSGQPADGAVRVLARVTDRAGNTLDSAIQDVFVDNTNPTGSLTAPADGAFVAGTVAVSSDSADAGSGVASVELQRRPAGGGAWTAIATDTTAPYSADWDTTALGDGDYDLRVVTTDQAGNTFTSAGRTVTVDNSPPSAPVVTLSGSSPFAHVSGSEIFVNTDETGAYDVSATSSDPHSGIDKIRFPGPTDDSSSPYQASYALGDLSGAQVVTAFNGAGLTASSPFTVTPDTAEPAGGSVSYPDGYDADGDVTVSVDAGTDALSGLAAASAVLERRTAALDDDACDPFSGGWSPVSSPDTVGSGLCAQYRYRVSDRVGNEATYTSASVVKVDLVGPAAPVLTLVESSPFAHVVGTQIFVNTTETGAYDVQASTSDAASGIDKVAFPGGVEDTTAPYEATYDFDDLLGTETVTAHDRAGNTSSSDFDVTEDVSAPSTTDDTGSIGPAWQTAPVTVTLAPTDAGSGVAATYYTTDGSVPTPSSDVGTSVDLTADGVHVIRYFSVDNVGNAEPVQTASTTIRVDQTDPSQPAITLDESSPYAHVSGSEIFVNTDETGTYDVSGATSDAGSGIARVAFPGGIDDTTSPYSATYDLDDLSGAQTVTAHDVAGNTASDTFTVTPDTTAPAGGFVDYPDGYDADGTVTVTYDPGSDAGSGVNGASGDLERRTSVLSGGVCAPFVDDWSAVTSPDTVPDSTCARYRYRVFDRVGNEAIYTLATSTVKVDLTAPQTTIDVAPADPSNDSSPAFEFSASEGGSTFECRLDGGAWSACSSPEGLSGLGDGSHTFEVRATDAAGLTDPSPASHTWTVDTAAPSTSVDAVPPDPSNDDAPTFEFSASEPGSSFECRLDGGAWSACSSPETVGLLADGAHTFDVRATDAAGNVDLSPASHAWTVDTVAPDSSFSLVPANPTNDVTPTFEFSASEPGSTFECRLDGGAWSACSSPETRGPLADGSHTFEVRATDPAGNQETVPAAYTWVVDAGAPAVTITQPSGFVNASDADPYTLRATSPDADIAGVEFFSCSNAGVDCAGGAWVSLGTDATAPYEASWPVAADGNRALRAVATDTGSATGADVVNVTIDRTAPATTIDAAPSDPAATADATFEFSSSEGSSTFECRLDGDPWDPCSSPHGYTGLADGGHTFRVRASDPAGNVDGSPAEYTWTIDSTAPGGGLTDPGQFLGGTVELTAAANDGGVGVQSVDFQVSPANAGSWTSIGVDTGAPYGVDWDTAALADGAYDLRVVVADNAGNSGASPVVEDRIVDNTAPATPGGFKGTVSGSSFSLSWKAASDNSGVISAYRIYTNGTLTSTVGGSSLSAPMGPFKLTDTRAFQVAAVDGAGNIGPLSGALKVVPKLAKLTVAAAKKALTKRGLKVGKITYRTSASVPKGRVIAGTAKGLRLAGTKIGLIVSRG